MADWQIRLATQQDEPRLNELYNQMWAAICGSDDGGEETLDFAGVWDEADITIYAAERDGRVIGSIHTERHHGAVGGDYLFLANFCVDAAHRCEGVGTSLLQQAEERAVALGLTALVLDVGTPSYRAMNLYRRMGFVPRFPEDDDGWLIKHLPKE